MLPAVERSEANKAPSEARLIKYIYIKKTAAKPPAERSEANKVPSAARLPERVQQLVCFSQGLSAACYIYSRTSIIAVGLLELSKRLDEATTI